MKACVVDDDYTSRQLISDYLEDEGLKVVRFDHPDNRSEIKKTSLSKELQDPNTKILIMDIRFGREAVGLKRGLKLRLPPFLDHELTNFKWNLLFLFTAIDASDRHYCRCHSHI